MSEKRTCTHPGCKTILSRFNETDRCSVHPELAFGSPRVQPRKERLCKSCQRNFTPNDPKSQRRMCDDCRYWRGRFSTEDSKRRVTA